MHIAICDDNVADRKQLERLLKRESDKRASTTGILYADSYGNASALLANPMQYDAFYIDVCKTEGITGNEIVRQLLAKGVNAPIVLCCSAINYREDSFPENVIFLDKPIKTADLSLSIDHAQKIKDQAKPMIELRDDKVTFYVSEPDILYAIEESETTFVTLTDGKKVHISGTALNFFSQVESYPVFLAPTPKSVVNGRHIEKFAFRKIIMDDGTPLKSVESALTMPNMPTGNFMVGPNSFIRFHGLIPSKSFPRFLLSAFRIPLRPGSHPFLPSQPDESLLSLILQNSSCCYPAFCWRQEA